MQTTNNNPFASEEIDLLEVLRKLIRLYKKWKWFAAIILITGIALSSLFYFTSSKTYITRMYVASNLLKGPSFIVLLDDLQKHIKDKNYEEVCRYLNVDMEMAKKIGRVEVFSAKNFAEKEFSDVITQSDNDTEKELNNNEFVIQAFVSDNTIAKDLEKGVIFYLENNQFTKMKSKQRKDGLKMVKKRIHSELSELDSLRYALNDMYTAKGKSGGSSIIMNDPSAIYNNILNLFRTEIATNDDINTPDVIVIQGFVTYKKHYSPRLGMCLISGFVGSLAFITLFIFFSELKGKLAEVA